MSIEEVRAIADRAGASYVTVALTLLGCRTYPKSRKRILEAAQALGIGITAPPVTSTLTP